MDDDANSHSVADLPPTMEAEDLGEKICCIGAGRMGILSMMDLATQWKDLQFYVLDTNVEKINKLNSVPRVMPFSGPGMEVMINECQNLFSDG
ncbi:UDP-glucose 6-dehydrogenase 2-like [Chenopodium quinoa]|uniref:UDP-glucose 6-dehydrogenase 2-like n=1 Tax=Chenopodium quinoa TaxID=63459 RepID=UPI000B78CB6B|nr:UDP-glucose 6-dehydrogenase 2-like [Chenopodium quinoa]